MAQASQGENDVVTVKHTVTLTRGNSETRVAIEEEEGSLVRGWEATDKILVTLTDGTRLGVMSTEDSENGVFSGDLILPRSFTEGKVNYIYMGSNANVDAANNSNDELSEIYNFNPVASVDALAANDVLSAAADVKVIKGLLVKEGGNTNLKSQVAYGHFALQFPTGVDYNNEEVSIFGDTFFTSAQLNFKNGELTEKTASEVKFNGADMYLTMVPTDNFEVNFKVNIDGTDWLGTLTRSNIKGGVYYRKGNVAENESNAVMVVMKRAFTITYDINGGSATNFPEPATDTKQGTDKVTFDNLPELIPTNPAIEFKGWSLNSDASEGANSIEVSQNETVYAIWGGKTSEQNFVIRLHNNYTGAEDLFATYDTKSNTWPTTVKIADVNNEIGTPTRKFHKFMGYKYDAEGTGSWATQIKFEYNTTSIDLYAQWQAKKYDVTIIAHENFGSDKTTSASRDNITLPFTFKDLGNFEIPTRSGYTFIGWGTSADAKTAVTSVYFDDENELTKHVYAIWRDNNVTTSGNVTIEDAIGTGY